jgi:4-diphosphocytidyl-2-C-methyl-D-erythritol kinase
VVLAVPTFPVSTGEAYGWLDRARADGRAETPRSPDRPPRRPLSWEGLAPFAVNDFEAVVFPRYPRLRAARDTLLEHGAGISLLAGTGSTVFGIFQSGAAAEAAAEALQRGDPSLRILHTRTAAR